MILALFGAFGLFATSAGADDTDTDTDTDDAGTNPDLSSNPNLETDQPDLVPDDTVDERNLGARVTTHNDAIFSARGGLNSLADLGYGVRGSTEFDDLGLTEAMTLNWGAILMRVTARSKAQV